MDLCLTLNSLGISVTNLSPSHLPNLSEQVKSPVCSIFPTSRPHSACKLLHGLPSLGDIDGEVATAVSNVQATTLTLVEYFV